MKESLKKSNGHLTHGVLDATTVNHLPAQLKEFKSGWVIEYYYRDPETRQFVRHREKFQRIRKKMSDTAARKLAGEICRERNKLLSSGWNPLMVNGNKRSYTRLSDALDSFLKEKLREIRPDTQRVYKSHVSMFKRWILKEGLDTIYVKAFSQTNADDYLTFQYVEEGKSACTYNNYLTFFRGLFNFFIEKEYCDKNPFSKIRKKKEQEKKRDVIPPEWDKKIMDYCCINEPRLALICMLVNGSFLRPAEICRVKIQDIRLDKSAIFVPGENAKNAHSRWAVLTRDTVQMIKDMHIMECPPEWYLISTSLLPGTKKKETRDIDKRWDKMRKKIKMPDIYQLYSYRDTGIMYLKENGVPDYLIVKLTGHRELDMLQKYTHAPSEEALRLSAQFLPKLGDRTEINHAEKSNYSAIYGQYAETNIY